VLKENTERGGYIPLDDNYLHERVNVATPAVVMVKDPTTSRLGDLNAKIAVDSINLLKFTPLDKRVTVAAEQANIQLNQPPVSGIPKIPFKNLRMQLKKVGMFQSLNL